MNIILTSNFKRGAKKLQKKYPSLKNELQKLGSNLNENPKIGIHLGNNIYKIRLAVKSKVKGKSGGVRIMSQVKVVKQTVYLFSIYSKGEKDDISNNEIENFLKEIPQK